jgi:methylphosphotriester-DNA--protein-cysteine methyltransferase
VLDPQSYDGWVEASSMIFGSVSAQGIFCSPSCASTLEQALDAKVAVEEARKSDLEAGVQPELPEAKPTKARAKK